MARHCNHCWGRGHNKRTCPKLTQQIKDNYDDRLAAGSIAAGGTIGILIPPSIALIIYGILVEEDIGKLFMAGIIPGILTIVLYIIVIRIVTMIKKDWGPPGQTLV